MVLRSTTEREREDTEDGGEKKMRGRGRCRRIEYDHHLKE